MAENNAINAPLPLAVSQGGTGVATLTTAYGVLCAGTTATGDVQTLASLGSSGEVLTSNGAGALPSFQAAAVQFTWAVETGTSGTIVVNTGTFTNNAGLVTLTLPATAAVGDEIAIVGMGAGGWLMAQNASQTVHYGTSSSTTGAGGSIASTAQRDAIRIVCNVANTDFTVVSSIGNLDVT